MDNNIAKVLMLPASNFVKDKALTTIQHMSTEDGSAVLMDLDTVGDNFPQEDTDITRELRELVDKAYEKDCQFLYLY